MSAPPPSTEPAPQGKGDVASLLVSTSSSSPPNASAPKPSASPPKDHVQLGLTSGKPNNSAVNKGSFPSDSRASGSLQRTEVADAANPRPDSGKTATSIENPSMHGKGLTDTSHRQADMPKIDDLQRDAQKLPHSGGRSYSAVASTRPSRPPDAFATNMNVFHPVKHGASTIMLMPESLYSSRLQAFQYALIGRLFLPKGSPPRPLPAIKSELTKIFKSTSEWNLVPLGKGFFSLKFACQEDQQRASRFTSWKLAQGNFHLREWKPDFNPYREQTSTAQVWVRLFHLPEEYWDPEFLVGVFRAAGNVVKLDGSTVAGLVGHFARALVEIDLRMPLTEFVTIGRSGSSTSFQVEFSYENLLQFCNFCKYIGHTVEACNHAKKKADEDVKDTPQQPEKQITKGIWQEKKSSKKTNSDKEEPLEPQGFETTNSFAALEENIADAQPSAQVATIDASDSNSQHAPSESEKKGISGPDLMELVTVPIDETGNVLAPPKQISKEAAAAVQRVNERAREIERLKSIRASLPLNDTPNYEEEKTRLLRTQLRSSRKPPAATHSPHPSAKGISKIHDKLQQAVASGAKPTDFDIDPGEHKRSKPMNQVAEKKWSDLVDNDSEEDEPAEGLSLGNPVISQ